MQASRADKLDVPSARGAGAPVAAPMDALREALVAGRNRDGGWGYYPGKASRLEPTCWALLSLSEPGDPEGAALAASALRLVANWQRDDGLLAEPGLPPNLAFNGLAGVAFATVRSSPLATSLGAGPEARLLAAIVGVRSKRWWSWFSPSGQDVSLVGWPWSENTYAWLEPTAWCTFALKLAGRRRHDAAALARVAEAEQVLRDRQSRAGGWNYGNGQVLGQDLRPYVPTTALALLALQDRRREQWVQRALDYLRASWRSELAGMALGLSLLCFRTLGGPADEVETALREAWRRTGCLGNHSVIGLASYALTAGKDGTVPFAL